MNPKLIDLFNKIQGKKWFQRRHYEAFATLLRYSIGEEYNYTIEYSLICDDICNLFDTDNPRFDSDRFMKACGVTAWRRDMMNVPDDVMKVMYDEDFYSLTYNEMENL